MPNFAGADTLGLGVLLSSANETVVSWDLRTVSTGPRRLLRVVDGLGAAAEFSYGEPPSTQPITDPHRLPQPGPHRVLYEVSEDTPDPDRPHVTQYAFEMPDYDPMRRMPLGFGRTRTFERYGLETLHRYSVHEAERTYSEAHAVYLRPFAASRALVYTHLSQSERTHVSETLTAVEVGPTPYGNFRTVVPQLRRSEYELEGFCTFGGCPGEPGQPDLDALGVVPYHRRTDSIEGDADEFGNVAIARGTEMSDGVVFSTEYLRIDWASTVTAQAWIPSQIELQTSTSQADGEISHRSGAFSYGPHGEVVSVLHEQSGAALPADVEATTRLEAFAYDAYGNVTTTTNTSTSPLFGVQVRSETVTMDEEFLFPSIIENELGHVTGMVWDRARGLQTTVVGPTGTMAQSHYDGFGRLVRAYRNDATGLFTDGTELERSYVRMSSGPDDEPSPMRVEETAAGVASAIEHDIFGHEVRAQSTLGDGSLGVRDFTYDARGLVITETVPWPQGASGPPDAYAHAYDELGRRTSTETPEGGTVSIEFDGNTTSTTLPGGETWVHAYGPDDQLLEVTDPLGTSVCRSYGPFGKLSEVHVGCASEQSPDAWIDPDCLIAYSYDAWGNLLAVADPNRGPSTHHYDGFHDLRRTHTPSDIIDYATDPLGRIVQRTDGQGTASWRYDTGCHEGDAPGLLCRHDTSDGLSTGYGYDGFDRVIHEQVDVSPTGVSEYQRLAYDNHGRLASRDLPAVDTSMGPSSPRERVEYGYDASGALAHIADVNSGLTVWRADQRDASGRVVRESYGDGVSGQRSYLPDGHIQAIVYSSASTRLQELEYAYDGSGNTRTRWAINPESAQVERFTYDPLN